MQPYMQPQNPNDGDCQLVLNLNLDNNEHFFNQVLYKVIVDGIKIQSVEIKAPKSYKDVKVFAGDDFYPEADASYKNLIWETFEDNDL